MYIYQRCFFLILTLSLLNPAFAGSQLNTAVRAQQQYSQADHSQFFQTADAHLSFAALDVDYEVGGMRVATTLSMTKLQRTETKFTISEAYYDFSLAQWFGSIGKKKVDWGVGYGFRPLDLFSPTKSLALYTAVPPGSYVVTGDYFTQRGNVSLLCNESKRLYLDKGRATTSSFGCGGRYYHYFDNVESQFIAHFDRRMGWRVGGSAVTVFREATALYGSLLWQSRYQSPTFKRGLNNAWTQTTWHENSLQALIGVNHSMMAGVNVIAEYWFDGRAPKQHQWRQVLEMGSASLRGHYATQNLFQHNLMLHVRGHDKAWQPSFTAVLNPQDSSMFIDGKLCYSQIQGRQFCAGARRYLGSALSIYGQLGQQQVAYLSLEIKL